LSRVEWAALDGFAERVACHANWLGLWQADFIRKNDRWYLLEINPRWTASMELLDASMGLKNSAIALPGLFGTYAKRNLDKSLSSSKSMERVCSLTLFGETSLVCG
jgi:predicted ATP-grasp superfamily ATP-dependent carboligase